MTAGRRRSLVTMCAFAFASLALPAVARADTGPPVIWLGAGVFVVAVVEVIVVLAETPVLWRFLGVSLPRAFVSALAANALSAVVGIPIAFVVGDRVGTAIDASASLGAWASLAAPLALVLASFVCSSLLEWPVVKLIARRPWRRAGLAVLLANAVSHVVLLVILVVAVLRAGA